MAEPEGTNNPRNNVGVLEGLLSTIKNIPRVAVGAAAYTSSYIPAAVGFLPLIDDSVDLLTGTRTPGLGEWMADYLAAPAGLYVTLMLQGLAVKAMKWGLSNQLSEESRKEWEEMTRGYGELSGKLTGYIGKTIYYTIHPQQLANQIRNMLDKNQIR